MLTLKHNEPDRVPVDLGGYVSSIHVFAYDELTKFLGLNIKGHVFDRVQQIVKPDEEVLRRFGIDFRHVNLKPPRSWQYREFTDISGRTAYVDEWGVKWGKGTYYFDMLDHPLKTATVKDLDDYSWPDPHDQGRTEGLKKEAKVLFETTDFAMVADSIYGGLFECSWWLRGFENFLVDMRRNPEFANALLDKLLELYTGLYDEYLRAVGDYVHIVQFGDDYGMQTGPIMAPHLFRTYIKPRIKKLYNFIKSNTDAKIFHHSCGSVYLIIEDLIDVGVDILNPIQPRAAMMNAEILKKEFGKRICFHGNIDIQKVLPFGTSEDVVNEVKRVIRTLAPGGGYILATAHNIQARTPPQNICAMFEAVKKYGSAHKRWINIL